VWTQTALYAGTLWQSMGYKDKLSAQTLISQIIKFREKQFPYKIGYNMVVLVVNDIVDLNHRMFNQADNQYTSNEENNNLDIAMNDDHEFNLEELIHDQDIK
ncbi:12673_t:CDS:2, partial [Dentiscutata heterogama]